MRDVLPVANEVVMSQRGAYLQVEEKRSSQSTAKYILQLSGASLFRGKEERSEEAFRHSFGPSLGQSLQTVHQCHNVLLLAACWRHCWRLLSHE
jgi:hypothetical protein